MRTRNQTGQVFFFLFIIPIQLDLINTQVRMRPIRQRHRGTCAGDLLHRDSMSQIRHPCPAVLFINGHAEQPKFTHLRPKFWRETVRRIDLGGHRLDTLLRPTMHHIAQRINVLTQIKSHRGMKHGALPLIEQLFNCKHDTRPLSSSYARQP